MNCWHLVEIGFDHVDMQLMLDSNYDKICITFLGMFWNLGLNCEALWYKDKQKHNLF